MPGACPGRGAVLASSAALDAPGGTSACCAPRWAGGCHPGTEPAHCPPARTSATLAMSSQKAWEAHPAPSGHQTRSVPHPQPLPPPTPTPTPTPRRNGDLNQWEPGGRSQDQWWWGAGREAPRCGPTGSGSEGVRELEAAPNPQAVRQKVSEVKGAPTQPDQRRVASLVQGPGGLRRQGGTQALVSSVL